MRRPDYSVSIDGIPLVKANPSDPDDYKVSWNVAEANKHQIDKAAIWKEVLDGLRDPSASISWG